MTTSTVDVRDVAAQETAVIRRRAPLSEIGEAVQSGLGRSFEAVQKAGMQPSGPPVVRYLSMDPSEIEAEIGWPVPAAFPADGEVVASSIPAGPAAVVTYYGPYEGIGEAYEAITGWCAEHQRQPAGAPWECYFTDPNAEPDPAKWRTDVYQPVSA